MSFFQRLLGKTTRPSAAAGSLRGVLDQKAECLTDGSPLNNHKRCFAVLVPINLFAYSEGYPITDLSKHASDSCLFELACYTLFAAGMWAFGNAPQIREIVQLILSKQISHICEVSGLLTETDAYSLMNSRLEVYGGVASRNPSTEGLHLRLKQALHAASKTKTPDRASIDKVTFGDASSDLTLTKALVAWDLKRMPLMGGLLRAVEIN
jgi:hypothetical protein